MKISGTMEICGLHYFVQGLPDDELLELKQECDGEYLRRCNQTTSLDLDEYEKHLTLNNRKVEAIKAYRARTGRNLLDSKHAIDEYEKTANDSYKAATEV